MTIVFEAENANEEFLKVVKDIAKLANIKLKTQKKESSTQKALQELDNGEYETFEDFNAYKKAMSEL